MFKNSNYTSFVVSVLVQKWGRGGHFLRGGVLILNFGRFEGGANLMIYGIHLILQVQMASGITMPRFLILILMLELEQCPLRGPVI